MGLETYRSYWSSQGYGENKRLARMSRIREKAGIESGWGGAGDPIGAQSPMVQDSMLQQLARRATGENGRIDDWQSLIDPTVSYGSNLRKILQKGGKEIESTIKEDRKNWIESAPDRQQKHAKETIRENLDRIESGAAEDLREDIAEEFGAAFVESAIAEAKALETPAEDIRAPEPSTPKPETPETPESPETPVTPAETETPDLPDSADRPNLVKSAEPAETPAETVETAPSPTGSKDYSGVFGVIRLIGDLVTESYKAGKTAGSAAESPKQAKIESYA